jgi:putative transposase
VIEAEKANYPIKRMCELLEVSRSGYYKWHKSHDSGPTPARRRRADLDAKVAKFHAASDGVYGAPRILADLRADGETVSGKTVAASLRRQGLAGISPRRFAPATTVIDLDAAVPKTWWGGVSTPGCSTGCGPLTSPIWALLRAGFICARCVTAAHGG